MKKILFIALAAGFAAITQSQGLTLRASDQFSDYLAGRSYEGDVLPAANTAAPFIRKASGTITSEFVSGGALTFQTENPGTLNYQVGNLSPAGGTSPAWWTDNVDPAKGYTVEFRVQALTGAYEFNFIASLTNAVADDQVLTIEEGVTRWGSTVLSLASNDDAFHLFRLVREPNLNQYQVWRDGVQIGTNLTGSVAAENRFWFGDWGGKPGGGTLDYLRWDTSGAYAPVPEPSSLALVAGGLVFLGGRFLKRRSARNRPGLKD